MCSVPANGDVCDDFIEIKGHITNCLMGLGNRLAKGSCSGTDMVWRNGILQNSN